MLEIRPTCENCNVLLPNSSKDAMICTFECTFCKDCVDNILHNVCPNCGGGFTKRPSRPSELLEKYPVSTKVVYRPIDKEMFNELLQKYRDIDSRER
ncbi:hypothetical protein SAMN04487910_0797 [Aquimarina amphilecti]|uniref:Uncharacterized protein n=1 Tax=Aquimarina amphilecti TaxID=1038014 RepID=A0A1H7HYC2_AQUAM|nr:DUF1272 domain-containing protein [Aquimarina amphilecti]SEK55114.1 hypothetical protein SAMN04487910_0797 [Aquimarina amphilecti]